MRMPMRILSTGAVLGLMVMPAMSCHGPEAPLRAVEGRNTRTLQEVQVQEVTPAAILDKAAEVVRAGAERNDNSLKMKFRWCPPGYFRMGSPQHERGRGTDEGPVQVTLSRGFWLGQFEVTQAHWREIMNTTVREQRVRERVPLRPVGDGTTRDHVGEGSEYPMYFVSHADAEEFCRKLTEAEHRASGLPGDEEYALPTEAQWEYACRAGTVTATAFGEELSSLDANFDGTKPYNRAPNGPYLHETTRVGRYRANDWGLHDMHGNVWEWCRDGYASVLVGGLDPFVPSSKSSCLYRGGCWHNLGIMCRSAGLRARGESSDRGSGLGFRVARITAGSLKISHNTDGK
jgi:formylglycine-generating enzyme